MFVLHGHSEMGVSSVCVDLGLLFEEDDRGADEDKDEWREAV